MTNPPGRRHALICILVIEDRRITVNVTRSYGEHRREVGVPDLRVKARGSREAKAQRVCTCMSPTWWRAPVVRASRRSRALWRTLAYAVHAAGVRRAGAVMPTRVQIASIMSVAPVQQHFAVLL